VLCGIQPGLSIRGFRSWRDTGVTWLALAGVDVARIQWRAGHDRVTTTMGYVKAAEDVTGTIGQPFSPLPQCLVEPEAIGVAKAREWTKAWAKRRYRSLDAGKTSAELASPAGVEPEPRGPRGNGISSGPSVFQGLA
jgi:hypothetical protein